MIIKDEVLNPFEIEVEEDQYTVYKPVKVFIKKNGKREESVAKDVKGYFTCLTQKPCIAARLRDQTNKAVTTRF